MIITTTYVPRGTLDLTRKRGVVPRTIFLGHYLKQTYLDLSFIVHPGELQNMFLFLQPFSIPEDSHSEKLKIER